MFNTTGNAEDGKLLEEECVQTFHSKFLDAIQTSGDAEWMILYSPVRLMMPTDSGQPLYCPSCSCLNSSQRAMTPYTTNSKKDISTNLQPEEGCQKLLTQPPNPWLPP